MKALLLTDKANWSYHSIAKALIKFNRRSGLELDVAHIKTEMPRIRRYAKRYDRVLVMGWQNWDAVDFLSPDRTMIGIHSHHSWDDKKTTPESNVSPPASLIDFLNSFLRVNAVSKRLYDLFSSHGLKNVTYTPNGVDSSLFKSHRNTASSPFKVGYSGSKNHDWRKGVTKYIVPAAEKAGVGTSLAMLSTDDYVPLEEMPSFYNTIDCYVCASSSEGFSLSVLEAASCGKPIITTAVGGMTELIQDGVNGFIVPRDTKAIADKIRLLKDDPDLYRKMSMNIRSSVEQHWCWSRRCEDWFNFLSE